MSVQTAKRHGPTHPSNWSLPHRFPRLSTLWLHHLMVRLHHLPNDVEMPRGVVGASVPPLIDVNVPPFIDLQVAAAPNVTASDEVVLNAAAAVPLQVTNWNAATHAVAMAARRMFLASPPYHYPTPELDSLLDYSRLEREMHHL